LGFDMKLLHLAILFVLAAFSMAKAQECDFDILANGTSLDALGKTDVSFTIMIGEELEFTISPPYEDIAWIAETANGDLVFKSGPSYSPVTKLEVIENVLQTLKFVVENNCNTRKYITLTLEVRKYTVTFNSNEGSPVSPQTIEHEQTATKPADPTRNDYDFVQWELPVGMEYNFNTPVTGNITLTAKWIPKKYTVTFNSGEGSPISPQTTEHGKTATKPTNPTRANYDFMQWELPVGTEYNFSTPVTGNITLTAKWALKKYTVTFNSNSGSPVNPQTIEYGLTATKPATNPTRAGYRFDEWDFNFTTPITKDTTIVAKWIAEEYNIIFDPQGGTPSRASQMATYALPVDSLPTATRTGYTLDGWYSAASGGTKYSETTIYSTAGNTTLYAHWTAKKHMIAFNVNSIDGNVTPTSKEVTYYEAIGTLPTPTRPAHEFKGWFPNSDGSGTQVTASTVYQTDGNTSLYAKWEFVIGTRPLASMLKLDYIPSGLIYTGNPIDESEKVRASQKPDVVGYLGNITILYNGSTALPKDAGEYAISAFIDISADYDSATVSLGTLTIAKYPAVLNVLSATAQNKEYDATTVAKINDDIVFEETPLFAGDIVSKNDYSVNANFASPNVGENIPVSINIIWLPSGSLSKNYDLSSPTFSDISADITQTTGILKINPPPNYELSTNPKPKPTIAEKNPFINEADIIWEYKQIGDQEYVTNAPPNKVGDWIVIATLEETPGYTGAKDIAYFSVTRGSMPTYITRSLDATAGFTKDTRLSVEDGWRTYYIAETEHCGIENINISIMVDYDIVLDTFRLNTAQDTVWIPQNATEAGDYIIYEIPHAFGKPGIDTIIYRLRSKDKTYEQYDTLFIETPIPFHSITGQKWNNVIFVNNNPQTNGGYKFSDFKWFKNNKEASYDQFYSAGPSSKDTLNPSDVYKVTMQTTNGTRISTCEGNPKSAATQNNAAQKAKKQVLGINNETINPNSKIYNSKGERINRYKPGVYIITDN